MLSDNRGLDVDVQIEDLVRIMLEQKYMCTSSKIGMVIHARMLSPLNCQVHTCGSQWISV